MTPFSRMMIGVAIAAMSLSCGADALRSIPPDYPSHRQVGECDQQDLRRQLQDYNETRLALSIVLRHMATDPAIQPPARERLIGYAANLETLRERLPPPDPDSNEFRNFDFRLGMTLASMALFLNTEDPGLVRRFTADRDDPNSELGLYLAKLDSSRQQYMDVLSASSQSDCEG